MPNSSGSNLLKYLRHCSLLWDGSWMLWYLPAAINYCVHVCMCICVSLVPMMWPLEARNLLACRVVCGAFLLGSAYGWAKATALPLIDIGGDCSHPASTLCPLWCDFCCDLWSVPSCVPSTGVVGWAVSPGVESQASTA